MPCQWGHLHTAKAWPSQGTACALAALTALLGEQNCVGGGCVGTHLRPLLAPSDAPASLPLPHPPQEGMTVLRNIPVYLEKKIEIHRDINTG